VALDDALASLYDNVHMRAEMAVVRERMVSVAFVFASCHTSMFLRVRGRVEYLCVCMRVCLFRGYETKS
jgi:hypothetical protein